MLREYLYHWSDLRSEISPIYSPPTLLISYMVRNCQSTLLLGKVQKPFHMARKIEVWLILEKD
jgi:hypothetical protein